MPHSPETSTVITFRLDPAEHALVAGVVDSLGMSHANFYRYAMGQVVQETIKTDGARILDSLEAWAQRELACSRSRLQTAREALEKFGPTKTTEAE